MHTVDRVARAIAAVGLTDEVDHVDQPLDPALWQQLMLRAETDRLTGLLTAAVQTGALATTSVQAEDVAERDERWQGHALLAEGLLVEILSLLGSAGIRTRVIKGPALARTIYAKPEHRVFGDLDIVVPGSALPRARELLATELGADDPFPELRPGFDAEFAKDVLLRVDGLEIDLHRTIAPGPFGLRLPVAELFDDPVEFRVGSSSAWTLSPNATLVQACCNAVLGDVPPRLSSLRDVAQAVVHHCGSVGGVADLTQRWRLEAPVIEAITATWATLGLHDHPIAEWARGSRASALDRRLLEASTSTSRSYTRHIASVVALPGLRPRARYVRAIASPQRSYLDARGWQRGDHVTRAWRRLRSARRTT